MLSREMEGGSEGQILTFYSFKGGVGRTMAVANAAYLAAFNGLRVLMMDWDLEAPGLPYYFRGLLDPKHAVDLREAPGVLNVLWEWTTKITAAQDSESAKEVCRLFESGEPFAHCVRPVVADEIVPVGGALHLITAGGRKVATPDVMSYEDALSSFSWSDFFSANGGGIAVEGLRSWAKRTYDLVLIDSRTGLADVAGICTMQIPDIVALCFVLNRQNIDGVARVAGAIRGRRGEAVRLRAVPMRTARKETPEESDARAKAKNDLVRIGGFSAEVVQEDLKILGVAQAENVPFYEALAPLAASDPDLDPLTLNYVRLTNALLGRQLGVPYLPPDLLETARARLQPRHATVEYLLDLRKADPTRAVSEVGRLLAAAHEVQLDGYPLDEDYVAALVDTIFSVDSDEPETEAALHAQALDLLRSLQAADPLRWSPILVDGIEKHLASFASYQDEEATLSLLDEIDLLLSGAKTTTADVKRVLHRRRAAWMLFSESAFDQVSQIIGELGSLLSGIRREGGVLPKEQEETVFASELDLLQLKGCVAEGTGNVEAALGHFGSALERIRKGVPPEPSNEVLRIGSSIHFRVAVILAKRDGPEAGVHALEAVRMARGSAFINNRVPQLMGIVSATRDPALAVDFCEILLAQQNSPVMTNYFARAVSQALSFFRGLLGISELLGVDKSQRALRAGALISEEAAQVLTSLLRRRYALGGRAIDELMIAVSKLRSQLERVQVPVVHLKETEQRLAAVLRTRRRPSPRDET